MNRAEASIRREGYRYAGFSRNKEEQKKSSTEKRSKGMLVKTIDGSLYVKYKPLKPEQLELVKKSFSECAIEIAEKEKTLKNLELQLEKLKAEIFEAQSSKRNYENTFQELRYKLTDSGVVIENNSIKP